MSAPQIIRCFCEALKDTSHSQTALVVVEKLAVIGHDALSRLKRKYERGFMKGICEDIGREYHRLQRYESFLSVLQHLDHMSAAYDCLYTMNAGLSYLEMKKMIEDQVASDDRNFRDLLSGKEKESGSRVALFSERHSEQQIKDMSLKCLLLNYRDMYPESMASDPYMGYDYGDIAFKSRAKLALSVLMQAIQIGFALECRDFYKARADLQYRGRLSQKMHDLKIQDPRLQESVSVDNDCMTSENMILCCEVLFARLQNAARNRLKEHNLRFRIREAEKECAEEEALIEALARDTVLD